MARFGTRRFVSQRGDVYEIDLDLNDAALMDDHVELVVTGRVTLKESGRTTETAFTARLDFEKRRIDILHRNETVGSIPLGDRLDIGADFDDLETPEAWTRLREFIEDHGGRIEHLIEAIPAIDPVFGCLLRAGLSTAIGQLVACYGEARDVEGFRPRLRRVLRCLGVNSLAMAGRFIWRTGKCAVTGGWSIL